MFVGIDYYVLFHRDIEVGRAFYEALGLRHLHGGAHGHFFGLPGGGMLMLHPSEEGRPQGSNPQLYVTVSDIHAALAKHRAAGIEAFSPNGTGELPVTTEWGSVEYCVRDPEGHIWGIAQAR